MQPDDLDARLVQLLTDEPQLPVLECARRLGVARGTVTSRLARLHANGVVSAIVPQVDPAGFGYDLVAFCFVDIIQNVGHGPVTEAILTAIPEVTDLYTVTGDHDLHLRVVARNGQDLQDVLDRISQLAGVARTSSSLALRTHIQGRTLPLLHAVADSTS
ncbi:Lrp/AsnC family transcriptional regulator [Citricoccus sp. K5]|uniref:Lrp/AsnC family transcriptional regulator n=1 Tax=Citricoccus sp. K5 TaxID=2653135 RepID=UPI0013580482|nr:Lrp/AsnC family transcriptional regulator [Citricoccus sp. K5]